MIYVQIWEISLNCMAIFTWFTGSGIDCDKCLRPLVLIFQDLVLLFSCKNLSLYLYSNNIPLGYWIVWAAISHQSTGHNYSLLFAYTVEFNFFLPFCCTTHLTGWTVVSNHNSDIYPQLEQIQISVCSLPNWIIRFRNLIYMKRKNKIQFHLLQLTYAMEF